jgi:protein ImuB
MLVWCPDWPVVAAEIVDGVAASGPVAVLHANRVVASSPAARAEGVRRGLRKRDAQSRCPQLTVVDHDPSRDMRAYEPVVAAVEELVAGVAVLRPGVCAFAARGPVRYFGSEELAAERLVEHVGVECRVEAQIGVADGTFAALLAARAGRLIAPGETAAFLADLPVSTLERLELTDLLVRLGVRTLGQFAALPASDVLARFGLDAALAHRLAGGRDDRPLEPRQPPPDLDVAERFDEPIVRVDMAAFAARALAERLHDKLSGHGLACTRLAIVAMTAEGQELERQWRHDGILTAQAIADRTRWQLDGWLTTKRLACGLIGLRLIPEGVLAQAGLQPGLWGEAGAERERAHRALHRVQGMLGPGGVLTAVLGGGRDPQLEATLVPWGDERVPALPAGAWPGRLPAPNPAVVHPEPKQVSVFAADGVTPIGVNARLELNARPAFLAMKGSAGMSTVEIAAWAGPWPVDERWWVESSRPSRLIRLQAELADGRAVLLTLARGVWSVPAEFD